MVASILVFDMATQRLKLTFLVPRRSHTSKCTLLVFQVIMHGPWHRRRVFPISPLHSTTEDINAQCDTHQRLCKLVRRHPATKVPSSDSFSNSWNRRWFWPTNLRRPIHGCSAASRSVPTKANTTLCHSSASFVCLWTPSVTVVEWHHLLSFYITTCYRLVYFLSLPLVLCEDYVHCTLATCRGWKSDILLTCGPNK